MSKKKTRYTLAYCTVSPWDWAFVQSHTGIEHRSIGAAVRLNDRLQRQCQNTNGINSWIPIRIVAIDPENGEYRSLTEVELDEVTDIEYAMNG